MTGRTAQTTAAQDGEEDIAVPAGQGFLPVCPPIVVGPDECVVSDDARTTLVATLGACVAACLYDPVIGLGGMTHFLAPCRRSGSADGSGAALVLAMTPLLQAMAERGAQPARLEMKLFGGGLPASEADRLYAADLDAMHDFCARQRLRVVASSLGGRTARRLWYSPATGRTCQRFLMLASEDAVALREHRLLRQSAGGQGHAGNTP